MDTFFCGGFVGVFLTFIVAIEWNFNYDDIVVSIEDAEAHCGEEGPKSISFGSNEIECNNGRTLSWESPK